MALAVKSTGCSSPHANGGSQPTVAPVPGDSVCSSGIVGHYRNTAHTDLQAKDPYS